MKNKINDLRNHMFAQLERLGNEEISSEQLKNEISRAKAISDLGKVIVESAKTEILYAKLSRDKGDEPRNFLGITEPDKNEIKKIERPGA